MPVAIVTIGDELISGRIINKNSQYIAQKLMLSGIEIASHHVVPDNQKAIQVLVYSLLKEGISVISTGGLGPTHDDCTREALAKVFNVVCEKQDTLYQILKERYQEKSWLINQATLPKNAIAIDNPVGTAFGFLQHDRAFSQAVCIALPGVPSEMMAMLDTAIKHIQTVENTQKRYVRQFSVFGINETEVIEYIKIIQEQYSDIQIGIYPAPMSVTIVMSVVDHKQDVVLTVLQKFKSVWKNVVEHASLISAFHDFFSNKQYTIACAESCTGGAMSSKIVTQKGASAYFLGSIVAYQNNVKENLLDIPKEILDCYGAVSEQTVQAMAKGAKKKLVSDCAVAVSGILGPTGGTKDKPVGTICAAYILPDNTIFSWTMHLRGTRESLIETVVEKVLCTFLIACMKYEGKRVERKKEIR